MRTLQISVCSRIVSAVTWHRYEVQAGTINQIKFVTPVYGVEKRSTCIICSLSELNF